jgi:hypothetical protein
LLWTYTPVKDEVRVIIIQKLNPYLGETFLFNDFSIGINSISFYKIRAASDNSSFALDLEEIEIGFNIFKLLTNRFQLPEAIKSVTFVNPHFVLQRSNSSTSPNAQISPDRIIEEIVVNMQKFPDIDYITITGGEIYWQYHDVEEAAISNELGERIVFENGKMFWRSPGRSQLPLLEKLAGNLTYRPDIKEVNLNLQGKLPGIESSVIDLEGQFDLGNRQFHGELILNECIVNSNWPFWKLDFLLLENAQLQGEIEINSRNLSPDSMRLGGEIRIKDFSAYIFNQHVQGEELTLRPANKTLHIEPFDCQVEDGNGRFGGSIPDIFHPEADWELQIKNYSAKFLKNSRSIFEYAYEGKIGGAARFTGPFDSLDINATLNCPDLLYAVVPFNTVHTDLQYNTREKLLKFDYIRADFMKFRTRGTGEINFNNHLIKLWLDSDIDIPESYFTLLDGLNNGKILLHTNFSGDFTTKLFGGDFRYWMYGEEDTIYVKGRGPFILDDQFLNFTLHSDELSDNFTVKGTIKEVFSDPNFTILDVKDFPVRKFTKNPLIADFVTNHFVNFYFSGPYHSLQSKMKIENINDREDVLSLTASIRDIFMDNQRFKGRFEAHTAPEMITGDYEIAFSPEGMKTRISAPNLLEGELFSGAEPGSPFQGTIHIDNFSIAQYVKNSTTLSKIFEEGRIKGDMEIRGTVRDPRITFNLDANDLIINKVGYYNTKLSGELEDYSLTFNDFWVRLNSDIVYNADLSWNIITDSLNLVIRANNVESNFLAETIFKDPEIIRGNFSYTVTAAGHLGSPHVSGQVQVRDGYFEKSPFDSIVVVFEDSVLSEEDFWEFKNHIIKIDKFRYVNQDEYAVEGRGTIGIDPDSPIDFEINARGNVLAELPKIQPFFKNPQTDGILSVNLRGTRSRPYFEKINLQIFDGSLQFDGVIPPLTNMKAEVELTNAGNFIHIKTFEGLINNHWARIYNLPEVSVDTTKLAPWYFEEVGLNFGILVLQTKESGIPLSIPGLMEDGDIGYFAARGKKEGEQFYLAGPPELPVARGTLTMYNCRVTFPFIGMDEEEESYGEDNKVVEFLINMRWDIQTLPGTNNHYFVNIPAYVGEVFMDLNIDNASEGLEFTGRLVDESFRIEGGVESFRGNVEYLDVQFRVDRFGAEFNRFEIFPEVYGSAYTTVRDSTGNFPRDIYLKLYVIDPVTKKEVSRGRWEDFRFKLVSRDEVIGETQEQVLAALGYSVRNLQYKAGEVGLTMTENFLIRPLFRPIERQLERTLRLDYVRLRSNFTANLFYMSFQDRAQLSNSQYFLPPNLNNNIDPALLLIHSSGLTMGKYLVRNIYFSYTGQLVAGYEEAKLGINHAFGLEYRLLYNLLLEVELQKFQFNPFYSEAVNNDFSIRLRHSFNF